MGWYSPKRKRVALDFSKQVSLTKQSFRDECDINVLMRRYEKTGLLTHVNKYRGEYGDFGDEPDYQVAMNKVIEAREMFMSLPAAIRTRFGNDPGEFIAFVSDEGNAEEMYKLGLAVKKEPAPPQEVRVVSMPEAKTEADEKRS